MSRSRRKTPICGFSKRPSEKRSKQRANRRLRRAINSADLVSEDVLPVSNELTNQYMDKDGKHWLNPDVCDKETIERIMRK